MRQQYDAAVRFAFGASQSGCGRSRLLGVKMDDGFLALEHT